MKWKKIEINELDTDNNMVELLFQNEKGTLNLFICVSYEVCKDRQFDGYFSDYAIPYIDFKGLYESDDEDITKLVSSAYHDKENKDFWADIEHKILDRVGSDLQEAYEDKHYER